jgi:two-component system, OmpR family, sensor histidine kinase VicK
MFSLDNASEKTRVLHNPTKMIDVSLQIYSRITEYMDAICDDRGVEVTIKATPIWNGMNDLKNKGVHLRWITNITPDNLKWCKEFMKLVEVRHIDGIKGAFGIHDNMYYMASANVLRQGRIFPSELIVSNVKVIVQQQQQIFNLLWDKAIPGKQRIKEIELGTKREFIDTIRDPDDIIKVIFNILNSATYNIEILFSSYATFHGLSSAGILDHLIKMKSERNIEVRALLSVKNKNEIKKSRDLSKELFGSNITTFVADSALSLAIEMNDSNQNKDLDDSFGIAAYSNSQSTVNTYEIIFENLWNKSEFETLKK